MNIYIRDINAASCSAYVNCFRAHGLVSLITSPTRCVPLSPCTLLDHVLSNLTSPHISGVVHFNITDHYPVFLLNENQNTTKRIIPHAASLISAQFFQTISTRDWEDIIPETCVEKTCDIFG